jgi:hypothetical protein
MDDDRIVQSVPQLTQHELARAHDRIAEIRSDLPRVFARATTRLREVDAQTLCLVDDRLLQRCRSDHRLDQHVAMRQIGSDRGFANAPEVKAQEAIRLAGRSRRIGRSGDHASEREARVERDARLATVDEDDQELAQRPHACPRVGEQGFEQRILLAGCAAPQHGHGNELHIERRVLQQHGAHLRQRRRWRRRACAQRIAVEDHREHRTIDARERRLGRFERRRQPAPSSLLDEHE